MKHTGLFIIPLFFRSLVTLISSQSMSQNTLNHIELYHTRAFILFFVYILYRLAIKSPVSIFFSAIRWWMEGKKEEEGEGSSRRKQKQERGEYRRSQGKRRSTIQKGSPSVHFSFFTLHDTTTLPAPYGGWFTFNDPDIQGQSKQYNRFLIFIFSFLLCSARSIIFSRVQAGTLRTPWTRLGIGGNQR